MVLFLAFSLQDKVEEYGAYVGLAAFLGLAVLTLLYFAQARELKRLRDWAGRAPERAQEIEARVVAQAEDARRAAAEAADAERTGTVAPPQPVTAAASGNGRQAGTPAIPLGPRPAVALAAATAAATAVAAPVSPEEASGDGAPAEDAGQATTAPPPTVAAPAGGDDRIPGEAAEVEAADGEAAPGGDQPASDDAEVAAEGGDQPVSGEAAETEAAHDDRAASRGLEPVPGEAAAGDEPVVEKAEPPGVSERAPGEDDRIPAEAADAPEAEPGEEPAPAGDGNDVPIPRATPRPQPRPAPAAALRSTTTRSATPPPRGAGGRDRASSRAAKATLLTLIGVIVVAGLAFGATQLLGGDETTPPPNRTAGPGTTPAATGGSSRRVAAARPDTVVAILNGTPTAGLASGTRDSLVNEGYSDEQGMIRTGNSVDQQRQDSVVLYATGRRRQARDVANILGIEAVEQIDADTQALADSADETGSGRHADVVAILGADQSP